MSRWINPLFGCGLLLPSSVLAQPEDVLETVVVAAPNKASALEARRQASSGKLIFDREDLDQMGEASVGELLRKLPGVGAFADSEGRAGRGKKRDRFMPTILVDGQPLPGGDRSASTALRLSVELLERVEVIRSATPEFPYTGPGGVINLVLKNVPAAASRAIRSAVGVVGSEPALRLDVQQGDRLSEFGYSVGLSVQDQPRSGAHQKEQARWSNGSPVELGREVGHEDGRDLNVALTPRAQWSLGAGHQVVLSSWLSSSRQSRQDRLSHLIQTALDDPLDWAGDGWIDEKSRTDSDSVRLNAEWRNRDAAGGDWSARLTAQGEVEAKRSQQDAWDQQGVWLESQTSSEQRIEREVSAQVRHKRGMGEAHVVTGALEWRGKHSEDQRERSVGGAPQLGLSDGQVWLKEGRLTFWVQDEWQCSDNHLLTPGFRWQSQGASVEDVTPARLTRRTHVLEPSLHYLWQITEAIQLRSSLSVSSKPPGLRDLTPAVRLAAGVNTTTNPDKTGNPDLRAERTQSLDLGVERYFAGQGGVLGVTGFSRHVDSKVERLLSWEGWRWVERPYNVGDAQEQGAVADLKWRMDSLGLSALTLRANAAWMRVKSLRGDRGKSAAEGPRRSANVGWEYLFDKPRIEMGININYTGSVDRERTASVWQQQGPRHQVDLYANWRIDTQMRLKFAIQNLSTPERVNRVREWDAAGLPIRQETDRDASQLAAWITYEIKL